MAFNVFQENPNEFVIPKGEIHLGERFVREKLSHRGSLFLATIKGL